MTTTTLHRVSALSGGAQAVVAAARELREAKQFLRAGHLVRGVQRHERAKRELYQATHALTGSGPTPTEPGGAPLHDSFQAFLVALQDFRDAYDRRRADTSDGHATRALIEAEKKVIGELGRLEHVLN